MVLDIATGLVNDNNARQYLNPESNDFSSSGTRFAIDVANMASEGVGQGKTLTLSLHWLSSHKKDHPSVKPELTAQRFFFGEQGAVPSLPPEEVGPAAPSCPPSTKPLISLGLE
jgi:hypothetical protein